MVKTSSKRSRGSRGNVSKRVIRIRRDDATMEEVQDSSIISKVLQKVGPLAKAQWNFHFRACTKWNLIPVTYDPVTGKAGLSALWKRYTHYTLVALYAISMINQLHVTLQRLAAGNLDLFTYISLGFFLISVVSAAVVLGSTCSSSALCNLLNSCKSMEQISESHFRSPRTKFDDDGISFKVLLCFAGFSLIGINAAMSSLVLEVPASVLPTLTRIGWLELPDYVPRVLWALLFLPLELLTLWPPLFATGLIYNVVILGLGTFKVFAVQVRKQKLRNMTEWMEVYRLRRILQVHNVILMNWAKNVVVTGFTGPPCAAIVLLYITIRPSNIPWIIYIWIPVVVAQIMIIISWATYDCVIAKRTVADVDENLQLGLDSWRMRDLKMRRRTVYSRMLKSFRPASFRLGAFAEVTLDAPINAWDEVLNQLLFLLSF